MRTTTATVDRAVYHTHRHAPVNLAGMDHHDQEKSREQNLNLLSSKPETEVTNDRRRIVLLKEDTKHRVASATAGLLVGNYNEN